MKIPQIDVQKTHKLIDEMAMVIPSGKMFEIILRSIDVMMDDIVEAREGIVSKKPAVLDALAIWDEAFEGFGEREAFYFQGISEAESDAELEVVAVKPLLRGEYIESEGAPDWPDVETPWRLMNTLALIAAQSGKKKAYFTRLRDRWMDNFARFWVTSAVGLSLQAKLAARALPETVSFEGPGISVVEEDASLYDQAAGKARGAVDSVSDFFSGKTIEEAKRGAKHVGIGLGVGLIVGAAVAVAVLWRIRKL